MNPITNNTHISITAPTVEIPKREQHKQSSKKGGCKYPFPQRLFDLLETIDLKKPELSSIISWDPNGKHFRVHNREEFAKVIQKEYFNQSKYASFRRQLNLWGFERIPDQEQEDSSSSLLERRSPSYGGCFFHPLFQRNDRRLCCTMSRIVGRDGSKIHRSVSITNCDDTISNITSSNSTLVLPSSLPSSSSLVGDLVDPIEPTDPVALQEMMYDSSFGLSDTRQNEAIVRGDELLATEDELQLQQQEANINPASFSCKTTSDDELQSLINFLSANDDHIYKYLFEQ